MKTIPNQTRSRLELHLTCGAMHATQIPSFVEVCEQVGLKPLLVDLPHGEQKQQPMATIWLRGDLADAKAEAMALAQWLAHAGMAVQRVKVEAPLEEHESLGRPGHYFRWNGKLRLRDTSALQPLCEAHGVRLSRDHIGDEPDVHFMTLRSHEPLAGFKARVAALAAHLEREGWPLMKQHSQICLHDSSLQASS
ncbi:hypothetical protein [uncultured Variovorax sp.]|uniref:hypothetical protein n=1 Tax=uncultured Variovorax sp. TaxID=114708 RepID=UPI0025E02FAE|nr:hypothetical protein [uncultured Variovorax sp.]